MDPDPKTVAVLGDEIATSLRDAMRHLGWAELSEHVAAQLASTVASERLAQERRELAAGAVPAADSLFAPTDALEHACRRLDELDGMEELERADASIDGGGARLRARLAELVDLGQILAAARRGAQLDSSELWAIRALLEAGERLHWTRRAAGEVGLADGDADTSAGLRAIDAVLARTAATRFPAALSSRLTLALELGGPERRPVLADAASAALGRAREAARAARKSLVARAEQSLRAPGFAESLRDTYWTERDGRVVLPIRSDAFGTVRAQGGATILHGASASGNTLYVEPQALLEANNVLRQAQAEVLAEEHRILVSLSREVRDEVDALASLEQAMIAIDLVQARLAVSRRLAGKAPILSDPTAAGERPRIELRGARHPLMVLAGVDVVPSDLELELGHALIISGPNAGGKTVALKTLGLFMMMARAGLRLPTASPGRLPCFAALVSDVGDDQSITASLSTFSAHLSHVRRALRVAAELGPSTLVLMDEIAAGTDPEQGAALAEAILLALADAGATVVVTTHHERLKLLAGSGGAAARFHNAAVGFDLERLRPTFRLQFGLPGSSCALAVARRIGLPEPVVVAAEARLVDRSLDVETLLQTIDRERRALVGEREALAGERQALAEGERRLHEREERARAGARDRKVRAWESAAGELRALESELRARRKALHRGREPSEPPPQDATTSQLRARIESLREPGPVVEHAPAPASVVLGQRVLVRAIGREGEVVDIRGAKVSVQLGHSRVAVTLDELATIDAAPREAGRAGTPRGRSTPSHARASASAPGRARRHFGADAIPVEEGFDNACDLRGTRAEDVPDALERFLAAAVGRDQDVVVIRHGHGSGAVREQVREHLARLRYVRRYRGGLPLEGGDAVTVAEIE